FGEGYDVYAEALKSLRGGDQFQRSRYDRTLAALDAGFGAGETTTAFYENLFDPASGELESLMKNVGLSPLPPLKKAINASPPAPPAPDGLRAHAKVRLKAAYDDANARFGTRVPDAWTAG
ncbi:MAG: hypothetical protein AAF360_17840, partial [Pseudomonadota bacterium]